MLWLAAFFAQLGPSPVSDGFVSGDRAYLLLPPVPVCGNVIRSFGWSPDGKRAAILSIDAHEALLTEIWVMNADGSNAKKLGDGFRDAWAPVWIKWNK